ncbi:MAG: ABC transporter substrate-binding protein [Nitrososphaerales archaeon]
MISSDEIVGEAKKEARLTIYGTVETDEMEPWLRVFNQKYPFLKLSYQREYVYGSPPPMTKRIQGELGAGGESADLVLSAISPHLQMHHLGMFKPYLSPERKNIPQEYREQEGYWTSILLLPTILAYNSKIVKKRYLPETIEELVDGVWSESIALHDVTLGTFGAGWLSSLKVVFGEERWTRFVDGLASLRSRRFPLFRHIVESISSGESRIGLTVLLHEYLKARDKKRSIERFSIDGIPLLTSATVISILSSSRHQSSAKLFIDFILSREGQQMIGNSYIRIPAGRDIDARYSIEKLIPNEKIVIFPSREANKSLEEDTAYYRNRFL